MSDYTCKDLPELREIPPVPECIAAHERPCCTGCYSVALLPISYPTLLRTEVLTVEYSFTSQDFRLPDVQWLPSIYKISDSDGSYSYEGRGTHCDTVIESGDVVVYSYVNTVQQVYALEVRSSLWVLLCTDLTCDTDTRGITKAPALLPPGASEILVGPTVTPGTLSRVSVDLPWKNVLIANRNHLQAVKPKTPCPSGKWRLVYTGGGKGNIAWECDGSATSGGSQSSMTKEDWDNLAIEISLIGVNGNSEKDITSATVEEINSYERVYLILTYAWYGFWNFPGAGVYVECNIADDLKGPHVLFAFGDSLDGNEYTIINIPPLNVEADYPIGEIYTEVSILAVPCDEEAGQEAPCCYGEGSSYETDLDFFAYADSTDYDDELAETSVEIYCDEPDTETEYTGSLEFYATYTDINGNIIEDGELEVGDCASLDGWSGRFTVHISAKVVNGNYCSCEDVVVSITYNDTGNIDSEWVDGVDNFTIKKGVYTEGDELLIGAQDVILHGKGKGRKGALEIAVDGVDAEPPLQINSDCPDEGDEPEEGKDYETTLQWYRLFGEGYFFEPIENIDNDCVKLDTTTVGLRITFTADEPVYNYDDEVIPLSLSGRGCDVEQFSERSQSMIRPAIVSRVEVSPGVYTYSVNYDIFVEITTNKTNNTCCASVVAQCGNANATLTINDGCKCDPLDPEEESPEEADKQCTCVKAGDNIHVEPDKADGKCIITGPSVKADPTGGALVTEDKDNLTYTVYAPKQLTPVDGSGTQAHVDELNGTFHIDTTTSGWPKITGGGLVSVTPTDEGYNIFGSTPPKMTMESANALIEIAETPTGYRIGGVAAYTQITSGAHITITGGGSSYEIGAVWPEIRGAGGVSVTPDDRGYIISAIQQTMQIQADGYVYANPIPGGYKIGLKALPIRGTGYIDVTSTANGYVISLNSRMISPCN